jgi:hypothetical protein
MNIKPRCPDAIKYSFDVAFICHQRLLSHNTEPNPVANFALLQSDKHESRRTSFMLSAPHLPLWEEGILPRDSLPAGETHAANQPLG